MDAITTLAEQHGVWACEESLRTIQDALSKRAFTGTWLRPG
jgi:hypothetical protein